MADFIHLSVHSEYSLSDGLCRIQALIERSVAAGMPALALTDHSNLFAAVKFYTAAMAAGIKPILGADLEFIDDESPDVRYRIIFLCQNKVGYANLTRLISRTYLEGQTQGAPCACRSWFSQDSLEGLIALSGGRSGDVGRALLAKKTHDAKRRLLAWQYLLPNRYYLELTRTGREGEAAYIQAAIDLALAEGVPVVASNDVRFINSDDFEAHEARVCIYQSTTLRDPRRERRYSTQQYLRTSDEMNELFADLPEALANSVEIAKRCSVQLQLGETCLPAFPIPKQFTEESYLAELTAQGLEKRLQVLQNQNADCVQRDVFEQRLATELNVINSMGFAGYFLIVADFIQWAKQNGVPVGPGRGSGAGSLVAYCLEITDVEPLRYELLFERFLNPERVSMPDFDIDFCMEGRDRVIDYVAERYGRDSVSQIITFGTMAAKAVVRDVGRVLGHPYGFVDRLAKLIPFELGITLDKALADEPALQEAYNNEDGVRELFDLAKKLEGVARNAGKHAGGVVMSPTPLTDFTALYCEPGGGNRVSQFDKDDVEAVGLVKFDFLGLRTLTIIDWALKTINQQRSEQGQSAIDIADIPLDDDKTFALLCRCETTAIFQLESRGMKDLIKRLKPDCFEEIVALVALFRPGPLQSGMVDDFINRKHGKAPVTYLHPALEPILKPTYGVILYQEQVMQIAQVLAGYTLGGADLLRRAMGKKKPEAMAKQRAIFTEGAVANQVDEKTATQIFDLMEKFAGYGFNKSHSVAYALVSYQTAWLKTHYLAAFMAAVLSSDMDNTDKVVAFIEDCRALKVPVLAPDINRSYYAFTADLSEQTIFYGLGAIKGVGEAAIEAIIVDRPKDGFDSLFDLCLRVDMRKINRRTLEALIRSGSLDALGENRPSLLASVDQAIRCAEQATKNKAQGQGDLFAGEFDTVASTFKLISLPPWTLKERLNGEKDTLGLYLTGHPLQPYERELAHVISKKIHQLRPQAGKVVVIAGMVHSVRQMRSKKGHRMAFMTLDDYTGRIDIGFFGKTYEKYAHLLEKDRLLIAHGECLHDDYTGGCKLQLTTLLTLEQVRLHYANALCLAIDATQNASSFVDDLKSRLEQYRGGACTVNLTYTGQGVSADIELGQAWRVRPDTDLLHNLSAWLGEQAVQLEY